MKKLATWPTSAPAPGAHLAYEIRCKCGCVDLTSRINPKISGLDTTFIAKEFQKKRWTKIGLGEGTCPDCLAAARRPIKIDIPDTPNEDQTMPAETPLAAAARSPLALKALPELYMMLGDYYDPQLQRYKIGWSDERIAKDLKLAPSFVAQRRDADFGKLAPVNPLAGVKAAAVKLRALAKFDGAIRELPATIEAFDKDLTELFEAIKAADPSGL